MFVFIRHFHIGFKHVSSLKLKNNQYIFQKMVECFVWLSIIIFWNIKYREILCLYDVQFISEQQMLLPTRKASNSVKIINYIWSKSSSNVYSVIFDRGIIDHHITIAFIKSCTQRNLTYEKFRVYSEKAWKPEKFPSLAILFYLKYPRRTEMNVPFSLKHSCISLQIYANCVTRDP